MDTQKLWEDIKHFAPSEFDDPTALGSGVLMNIEFVRLLDQIREECGFAFKIHSGFRTPAHNDEVGGVRDSAHMKGIATDIEVMTSFERYALVAAAIKFGIKRIGIGKDFVHLDMDFTLPQPVVWLYP